MSWRMDSSHTAPVRPSDSDGVIVIMDDHGRNGATDGTHDSCLLFAAVCNMHSQQSCFFDMFILGHILALCLLSRFHWSVGPEIAKVPIAAARRRTFLMLSQTGCAKKVVDVGRMDSTRRGFVLTLISLMFSEECIEPSESTFSFNYNVGGGDGSLAKSHSPNAKPLGAHQVLGLKGSRPKVLLLFIKSQFRKIKRSVEGMNIAKSSECTSSVIQHQSERSFSMAFWEATASPAKVHRTWPLIWPRAGCSRSRRSRRYPDCGAAWSSLLRAEQVVGWCLYILRAAALFSSKSSDYSFAIPIAERCPGHIRQKCAS